MSLRALLQLVVSLIVFRLGWPAHAEISFRSLGTLYPEEEWKAESPNAISDDGQVVVGESMIAKSQIPEKPNRWEAFRWTSDAGMQPLRPYPGLSWPSRGHGVSSDGSVVVGRAGFPGQTYLKAFRWTDTGGMVSLGDLGGSEPFTEAFGVSGDGRVVVGWGRSSRGDEGFRWTAEEGMTPLGGFPGQPQYSMVYDASDDGSIIVGWAYNEQNGGACRWTTTEGIQALGKLAGGRNLSGAQAVSKNGSVIIGWSESTPGIQAFRWANGVMVSLGDLPGGSFYSFAADLSDNGSVIVGWSSTGRGAGDEAFIWDAQHGMRHLENVLTHDYGMDLGGWLLMNARAISADGLTIVGTGLNPAGRQESWIAHIPEPANVVLMGIGVCVSLLTFRPGRKNHDRRK